MRGIGGPGTSLALALIIGCGSSGDRLSVSGQGVAGGDPPPQVPGPLCTNPDWPGHGPCEPDDPGNHNGPPQSECNLDAGVDSGTDSGTDGGTPPPPGVCGFDPYNDGLVGGQIADVAFDPRTPGVAWAAAGNRLFKSADSGANWSMIYEGTAFGFRQLSVPVAANVLYAATSSGVARSDDGGVSWTVVGLSGLSVTSFVVHPAQPLRIYAAVRDAGIMRSNDGGVSWFPMDYGLPYGEYMSIAADPANPDTILVAAWQLDGVSAILGSSILRTTNGGVSWTHAKDTTPGQTIWNIAICDADPNVMYASAGWNGLWKSVDRGVSWSTLAAAGSPVTDVAVAPTNCDDIYSVHYGTGLKRSTDGGSTFSGPLTNGIPSGNKFPRHVVVDSASTSRILGASHVGVLFSQNAGDNFALVGPVMNLAIRSLGVSPTDPNRLWMATWGSGVWQRADDSTPWARTSVNADYAFNVSPDPAVAGRTFVGTWSVPFVTTDGTNFSSINVLKNPFDFAFDPTASSTVYMTTQIDGLYKSTDNGANWSASNGSLTAWETGNGTFIDMRTALVDRSHANRIVIGTNLKGVYRSENGGATLDPVAPTLSGKTVSCLMQDLTGAFYACVDGSGIAKSTDGGANFSYVNAGLPSLNVNGLTVDMISGNLYSTSNFGVFTSTDGGASWHQLDSACLPAGGAGVPTVLGAGPSRKLVVATGRGLFTHTL
jgi:hypothetical protein